MNSGRIAIGLVIIIALAAMLVFKTSTMPAGYAATSMSNATSASVTVNGFVDVTLQNVPVQFPSVDPNTVGTAASPTPMNITYTNLTNCDVSTYLNSSANFTTGSYNFSAGNMSYNVTVTATGTVNTTCSTGRCRYGVIPAWVFNETAPSGVTPKNESVFHYIDVPIAQQPGTYTVQLRVCTKQFATAGCT